MELNLINNFDQLFLKFNDNFNLLTDKIHQLKYEEKVIFFQKSIHFYKISKCNDTTIFYSELIIFLLKMNIFDEKMPEILLLYEACKTHLDTFEQLKVKQAEKITNTLFHPKSDKLNLEINPNFVHNNILLEKPPKFIQQAISNKNYTQLIPLIHNTTQYFLNIYKNELIDFIFESSNINLYLQALNEKIKIEEDVLMLYKSKNFCLTKKNEVFEFLNEEIKKENLNVKTVVEWIKGVNENHVLLKKQQCKCICLLAERYFMEVEDFINFFGLESKF